MSEISNFSLSLELESNIKKSKSQYQTFRNRKLSFEASDLSKHPIKNLQSTINILSDKGDNREEEADDLPEQTTQNILSSSYSFLGGSSKPNKGKEKVTGDQSRKRNILPASGGRDNDSSSSEKEPDQRSTWHPKSHKKLNINQNDNA